MQPLLSTTDLPTKHLDSRTLLSPILRAEERHPTSNTLLLPIIMTDTTPSLACRFRDKINRSPRRRHNKLSQLGLSAVRTWLSGFLALTMTACSSMRLFSPIMMGPASAMMVAFGWTTVRAPIDTSPSNLLSLHTTAPGDTVSEELIVHTTRLDEWSGAAGMSDTGAWME